MYHENPYMYGMKGKIQVVEKGFARYFGVGEEKTIALARKSLREAAP